MRAGLPHHALFTLAGRSFLRCIDYNNVRCRLASYKALCANYLNLRKLLTKIAKVNYNKDTMKGAGRFLAEFELLFIAVLNGSR